jgi:death-on-curing protein
VTDEVEYLDVDDLLGLAADVLGEPVPIRDGGLLASAAARPQATIGGADAYRDLWSKAAALLQSLLQNHALVDGNKRLGWLATGVLLELNGVTVTGASNDAVHDVVMWATTNGRDIDEIAERLRVLLTD